MGHLWGVLFNVFSCVSCIFFVLMLWPPPRSTLFPYTTLFRSHVDGSEVEEAGQPDPRRGDPRDEGGHRRHGLSVLPRSEEHTSELQSRLHLVCRLLLEKKKQNTTHARTLDRLDQTVARTLGC